MRELPNYATTTPTTDYGYTGQRDMGMGLMDYKFRFYSPLLGRFISPDNITPDMTQGLNRYSYVRNNPVNFNDPSGHVYCGQGVFCGEGEVNGYPTPASTGGGGLGNRDSKALKFNPPPGWELRYIPGPTQNLDSLFKGINTGAEFSWVLFWVNQLTSRTRGNNIIIYGSRFARNQIGINPSTNRIGTLNQGNLFSPKLSALYSVKSRFTWAGIGLDVYQDYSEMQNGNYTGTDFSAAVTVDIGANLGIAATSGFLGGAAAGSLAGPLGTAGGAVFGTLIAIGSSYGMSSLFKSTVRDEWINNTSSFYTDPMNSIINIPSPIDGFE